MKQIRKKNSNRYNSIIFIHLNILKNRVYMNMQLNVLLLIDLNTKKFNEKKFKFTIKIEKPNSQLFLVIIFTKCADSSHSVVMKCTNTNLFTSLLSGIFTDKDDRVFIKKFLEYFIIKI